MEEVNRLRATGMAAVGLGARVAPTARLTTRREGEEAMEGVLANLLWPLSQCAKGAADDIELKTVLYGVTGMMQIKVSRL